MRAPATLKHLLISRTRQKLLHHLFYLPNEIYYVRQLVRSTKEEINSVRRELANLSAAGITCSELRGNRVYYWANPANPLYSDLQLLVHKTTGLAFSFIKNKEKIGKLKFVLYSRDFLDNTSKKTESIDLILVGDIVLNEVEPLIKKEETRRGREINYMIMNTHELLLRKQKRDPVMVDFFLNLPAVIVGRPSRIADI